MPLSKEARASFADALWAGAAAKWPDLAVGLMQCKLANAAGCSEASVRKLWYGNVNPSHQLLLRLANALGVEPDWLMPQCDQERLVGAPRPRVLTPTPKVAEERNAPPAPVVADTDANRQDATLTYRRLAGRLAMALAVAEATIDHMARGRFRHMTEEWGKELMAADAALRDAGVGGETLAEAASELGATP